MMHWRRLRVKDHRRCVSCRIVAPKSQFWRIVRCHPDRIVRLDQGMGRSVYLCPNLTCLKSAQKKDRLSRSLKTKVDAAVYHQLEARLESNDRELVDLGSSAGSEAVTAIA
jgi:uncharacterized protein